MRDLQINNIVCKDGLIAQLVEQRIENPRVTGSIPVRATRIYKGLVFTRPFFHAQRD
jgi:hypothetical protein